MTKYLKFICLLLITLIPSSCKSNYLNENNIESDFETNYILMDKTVDYLLSLKESEIIIECVEKKIEFYDELPVKEKTLRSTKIEQTIEDLTEKGYSKIYKRGNTIYFQIWRKPFDVEFTAGFAYSVDGSGDISPIDYLTYQREMPIANWYYYESDYNEWRARKHN